jgi:hypothetical protein
MYPYTIVKTIFMRLSGLPGIARNDLFIDPVQLGCCGAEQKQPQSAFDFAHGRLSTSLRFAKATADPSTTFGAKNAPNFAQDDSLVSG